MGVAWGRGLTGRAESVSGRGGQGGAGVAPSWAGPRRGRTAMHRAGAECLRLGGVWAGRWTYRAETASKPTSGAGPFPGLGRAGSEPLVKAAV